MTAVFHARHIRVGRRLEHEEMSVANVGVSRGLVSCKIKEAGE